MHKFLLFLCAVGLLLTTPARASDQISIVGSSTVFPFAVMVGEKFGRSTSYKTPIIESTGSGGGIKLFCSGAGPESPSVANASRRMKQGELETCNKNGVDVVEFRVGFDGIVLAVNESSPLQMSLSRKELYLALHYESKAKTWRDVGAHLPDITIRVIGPPPTSGTRDAFVELVMEHGCKDAGVQDCKKVAIRADGAWIDGGEKDSVIVKKLSNEDEAIGVFGFSFLDNNRDSIRGLQVEGTPPEFDLIASGTYPVARTLYFYVKKNHLQFVQGLQEYVNEWARESTVGEDGYLIDKGLIPLPSDQRQALYEHAKDMNVLKAID